VYGEQLKVQMELEKNRKGALKYKEQMDDALATARSKHEADVQY
jgi:hypothetical protein